MSPDLTLCESLTLKLNSRWQELKRDAIASLLVQDDAYTDALMGFNVSVVPDQHGTSAKLESQFQTIIPISKVYLFISDSDLIGSALHIASHEWCRIRWLKSPVQKSIFSVPELDFAEEVYNQRLISITSANHFSTLFNHMVRWDDQAVNNEIRLNLLTLLTTDAKVEYLADLHKWLYQSDPFTQKTFDYYVAWIKVKIESNQEFKQIVNHQFVV